MDTGQLVELLKIKLGIASNLRDKNTREDCLKRHQRINKQSGC